MGPDEQAQRSAQGVDNRAVHGGRLVPVHGQYGRDELLRIGFVEGVTYLETDTNLYDVTISGAGDGKVKATSADRQHKAKNGGGKHRQHGKHRK